MSYPLKTTWTHDASPIYLETTRNAGESDLEWFDRHMQAVWNVWHDPVNPQPPDAGTSITTTWTSGGSGKGPVTTAQPNGAGLRAWLDAHIGALLPALASHPPD